MRTEARCRELEIILADLPKQTRETVIFKMTSSYKAEIMDKVISLLKQGSSDMAWNMTIQRDVGDLLENLCKRGFFSYNNSAELSRGKYMGAVFEQYAALPYVEREKVFFAGIYSDLEDAIEFKRAINIIYTQAKTPFYVIPHFIEPDKLSMYNYLIGFARRIESPDEPLSIHSFRLSKIHAVEIDRHSKPGHGDLSDKQQAQQRMRIKKSREKLGTMFISDEDNIVQIEVRLTPKGKQKYIEQVHMRPSGHIKPGSENEYIFTCSRRQAEYYFYKFGKDAEVLCPADIREKFLEQYRDAMRLYEV